MISECAVNSLVMNQKKTPRRYVVVGNRVQDLRRKLPPPEGSKHVTQGELASRVGVAVGTVTAWENGYQRPEGENLVALAHELETTPEYILHGQPPNEGRGSVTLRPDDLGVDVNLGSAEMSVPRFRVRGEGIVGETGESVAAGDALSADIIPGFSVEEAERLLSEQITNPDLLRRQARTPIGDDVIAGIKSFLVRLDLTERQKNALDAYLNRIHAEAKGKR